MKRNGPVEQQLDVVKDLHNPVAFGPPLISPKVTDPAALRYAVGAAARQGAAFEKYTTPVAGGPTPPIPPLRGYDAAEGIPMAAQAMAIRGLAAQAAARGAPTLPPMFQESPAPTFPVGGPSPLAPQRPPAILPSDTLPPEARKDPLFRDGQGSMYAQNQPELAFKYGVIRNKQHIAPGAVAGPGRGLSEKTIEGLKAVRDLEDRRRAAESPERIVEREVAAGPAGAAARYGTSPDIGPEAVTDAEREKLQNAIKGMDQLDLHKMRDLMKDMLNNDEQKKLIESRCPEMTIDELIMNGFVLQRVPIIPGKFEPTFESTGGLEDLAIKRLIMLEAKSLDASDRYLLDKFSIMSTVLTVHAINGTALPGFRNADGKFEDVRFWERFELLARYPTHMIASLGVNSYWFECRVRKLFMAEPLGNG